MTNAEKRAKDIAPQMGFIPKRYPNPIPPNAAWDIPPLMNVILLTTT